jgi:hypothetical protein
MEATQDFGHTQSPTLFKKILSTFHVVYVLIILYIYIKGILKDLMRVKKNMSYITWAVVGAIH